MTNKTEKSGAEFIQLGDNGARLIVPTEAFFRTYNFEAILKIKDYTTCPEFLAYLSAKGFRKTFFHGQMISNALAGRAKQYETINLLGILEEPLADSLLVNFDAWAEVNARRVSRSALEAAKIECRLPSAPYTHLKPNATAPGAFPFIVERKEGRAERNYRIWPYKSIESSPIDLAIYNRATFDAARKLID